MSDTLRRGAYDEVAPLVVTVDTEADDAWRHPDRIGLANMAQIPRFQALCERFGIRPTYLLAYECATSPEALAVLGPIVARDACELGHHLHCWSTPPFERQGAPGIDDAWLHAYQYELPEQLFIDKAETLREAIIHHYGVNPRAHRAGRWGVDARTLRWLAERGFVVDSSVLPLRSLRRCRGRDAQGPEFHTADPRAHYVTEPGCGNLVELPATIDVPDSFIARGCAGWLRRGLPGAGPVSRVFQHHRVGGGRRLCPDPRYPRGALSQAVGRAARAPGRVVNLSLHSSELLLGCSPFSRTREQADAVWARLTEVFAKARELGLRPMTLSEAALQWRCQQGEPFAPDAVLSGLDDVSASPKREPFSRQV
ncbi:hypothetical protein [Alkalilimnicola sp. S0819]|uniref:hypothetical protein n=1 Tax=Alkalilimnicola sp. S0819 TaxID=2613922 RepID=UPI001262914E|nr:hypothetical protein [Alkalilimnicola sp. S0819]KAB7627883.1 hypothetical protein F3N43_02600 [Alkalilimnicola sp. S0819]MPQ15519.1 hypothetical protein [Alkalilimnicola sp. S0819]